jgi:hypothetical protein
MLFHLDDTVKQDALFARMLQHALQRRLPCQEWLVAILWRLIRVAVTARMGGAYQLNLPRAKH